MIVSIGVNVFNLQNESARFSLPKLEPFKTRRIREKANENLALFSLIRPPNPGPPPYSETRRGLRAEYETPETTNLSDEVP